MWQTRNAAHPLGLLMTGIVEPISIYVPRDFKGAVSRHGDLSGASISVSEAAHRLPGLRLNERAYLFEDEVIVHSTAPVRVCVMGEDPVACRVAAQETLKDHTDAPSRPLLSLRLVRFLFRLCTIKVPRSSLVRSKKIRCDLVCCFLEML
jgi:hypothetical protein